VSGAASGEGAVIALTGGVGGAKLALGLARVLPPEALTLVVNTGDDFQHLGLHICPDVDTLLYTLAGLAHPQQGWGRADETWRFMETLRTLGGPDWFALGDADMALHVWRTQQLREGRSLSEVTAALARAMGVQAAVVPMSDDAVRTRVRCDVGWLDFQNWFVARRCEPAVHEVAFHGAAIARPSEALRRIADDTGLRAVVICPSNPWLSVDPLLALHGVRRALAACPAPVVAVSPLVAGRAVKGPTAKLMGERGLPVNHSSIARHYQGLIDVLLVDADEPGLAEVPGVRTVVAPTLMQTLADREALARAVLAAADACLQDRR
jgi:LPPG:FO 2-phospho-L-lactate transferase